MSARPKSQRNECIVLLRKKNIYFDELILGVNPGTRYLINDIKPAHIFTKQAIEINVVRDKGIDNVECNECDNNNINIIKIFKGNSFCKTYLLKKKDLFFVRKYIIKTNDSLEHYDKLKRQFEDLKRFAFYDSSMVPKILNENDDTFAYYFDIEYLENYQQLDYYNINKQFNILNRVVNALYENVYCYRKLNNDKLFVEHFFEKKNIS